MNYYKQQFGKITLASVLFTSPILMALPATEVKAAATTENGKVVEGLIDKLPPVNQLTFEHDGQAVMEMQTAYLAMNYKDKGNLKNQEKYNNIVNLFIAEFEGVYKNPDYSIGNLYYFTSSFMNTQKLIENMKNMKPFNEIVLSDRTNIIALYNSLNTIRPYYEHYVQSTTSYTETEIDEAYKKVTMLNYVDLLQKKINDLPGLESFKLEHSANFKSAQTAYNNLMNNASYLNSEEAKNVIANYKNYENKYAEIETENYSTNIVNKMNEIGAVNNVTAKDNTLLNLLVTNYSKLLIPSVMATIDYELLLDMRSESSRLLALEVEQAIKKLGTVDDIKLEDENEIEEIKTNYATIISANAKGNVVSYDLFLNMQSRLAQLKTANDLTIQISKLPPVKDIKLVDYDAIVKIRQTLNTLDNSVQKSMSNYSLFTELEATVLSLKQDEITQTINEDLKNMTEPTKEEVIKIMTNFNLLTANNKVKINYQKKLAQQISYLVKHEDVMKNSITFYNATKPFMDQLSTGDKNFDEFIDWEIYTEKIKAYNEQEAVLEEIESDINQLPIVASADSKDIIRIKKIYDKYNALDAATKALIATKYSSKINDLYSFITTMEEANKISLVMDLINKLPNEITLSNMAQVDAANKEFNLLNENEKTTITNSEKLQAAILKIKELNSKAVTDLNEALLSLNTENIDVTDRSKLANLKLDYYKLTSEQQQKINHFDKVDLAEKKVDALYDEVAKFEIEINNLNPQESIEAVKKARVKFTSLKSGQQALVRNLDTLELYEFFIAEGMTSTDGALNQKLENMTNTQKASVAASVYTLIDQLPDESKLTINHLLAVMQAQESYEQLTSTNQLKVSNIKKLTSAVLKMDSLKNEILTKTEVVDKLITKLPKKITLKNGIEMQEVRNEINKLSIIEQSFINKYDEFLALENELYTLEKAEMKDVRKVILYIDSLPESKKITDAYESVLNEINESFTKLTSEQQKKVTNESKLKEALLKLQQLNSVVAGKSEQVKKGKLIVPTIKNTMTSISGKATPKAKVMVYSGNKKIASTTSNSAGKYVLKIKMQKKNTSLKFVESLDGTKLKTTTVKVAAAKVQAAASLKATATIVSGKATKNTKVKVYAGSTLLKTVKVNTKGTFSVKIPKQKLKTKLSITVYDAANNKSKTKKVKVK